MKHHRASTLTALSVGVFLLLTGCGAAGAASVSAPVSITVWSYYNGAQLISFNALVDEFNNTVGKDKGIVVTSSSQGTVSDLANNVLAAAKGEVGAEKLPAIVAAYADTAYQLDQMGFVADLDAYLTEEEQNQYVESFLKEGQFNGQEIKIFPVAKSVEILAVNETDWDAFARATGTSLDALATVEGVTETAEAYYNWADSLTPEPNDGKALFGRDAMANYFFAGSMQLGTELITVENGKTELNFDPDVIRKLWDNYYVPFVKGYFAATGRFRSDDLKTGNIIACVGSSSSATYLPDTVSTSDTQSHSIKLKILPCPQFRDGKPCAIQQGAGMVVTNGPEADIAASVEFLKWFTNAQRNIQFSVDSGYLPVTKAANSMAAIKASGLALTELMEEILTVSVDTVNENLLYTPPAFEGGCNIRNELEHSMSDQAAADRKEVLARIQTGQSLKSAAEDFVSDRHFEEWYKATLTQLQDLMES
ncbi:extracellular solute-binding protein [Oscillibacter sp.]|uniref:extracellular solute-binding protein n=1 Tax=Oscillibacter sp. TaxID=1945593 RepID=UPI0033995156